MSPLKRSIDGVAGIAPTVSVVMPSYNHGRHIGKAVASVLSQSFGDFELLISDDASSDDSWDIISKLGDSRVRSFRQQQNLGPVGNLVFLIRQARGQYIALLNSDDAWYPDKLAKQVAVMTAQPELGACFTWADLVDTQCREITGPEAIWNDVFRQPNRTQGQWLRHFFFKGNCLCHPSILARRQIYEDVGYYNPGLRQLPDFEMWIRLLKRYPIHVIQENLVGHLRDGNNTSAVSAQNSARNLTELVPIFGSFFDDMPDEIFVQGFAEDFRLQGVPATPARLSCEKLFLLLDGSFAHASGRAAALSRFIAHMPDPAIERVLKDEFGFSVFDLYRLTGDSGFGQAVLAASTPSVAGEAGKMLSAAAGHPLRNLKQWLRRLRQGRRSM